MTATVHSLAARRQGVVSLKLYQPRWYQAELHRSASRFSVWVCHRRAGKTVAVVNELIREAVLLAAARRLPPPFKLGYLAPFYGQAKRAAWDYLKQYTRPIPKIDVRVSALTVTTPWDARISLFGTDNPNSLRGDYFDMVVLDETAQISPQLWGEVVRPMLADREGRAIFIGTPMGRQNLFHRLWQQAEDTPGWSRKMLTVDDTDAISDDELVQLRREMTEDRYAQEMLCDWDAAVPGAYYARLLTEAASQGRIRDVAYDRSLPVLTSWDFGIADPTVVCYWQIAGSEIRCLGADAIADLSLPEIIAQIKTTRPYSYGAHYLPPDARRRDSDAYGAPQRLDIMAEHGFTGTVTAAQSLDDGIDAVKRGLPRVVFDAVGCEMLIEALRMYRSEYDDVRGIHRPKPIHDWTSHYADAVRSFFVATDGRSSGELWGQAELDAYGRELERSVI